MTDQPEIKEPKDQPRFNREVGVKVARKLKARRHVHSDVWFGLGMMGLIGWSVALPALLGTAFGIWLDNRHTETHSWTLTFLVIGLAVGCLNAWHWVSKEDEAMRKEQEDSHE